MLRLEAFAEMQKDNSKRFRCNESEYYVRYDEIYVKRYDDNDSEGMEAHASCSDKGNYEEVKAPLWKVIEDGDSYYTPAPTYIDLYSMDTFKEEFEDDIFRKNNKLIFRTPEEAIEVAKKMLEILKEC